MKVKNLSATINLLGLLLMTLVPKKRKIVFLRVSKSNAQDLVQLTFWNEM